MSTYELDNNQHQHAWDCDPEAGVMVQEYNDDLSDEDDTGDWQVLCLDRFGDRLVNSRY